ncbi:MAG: 7-carboxy-7-deazaguanine synthase QueE [Hydrococcus sp. Prado102]|jgi:organic radical activating enzyme|nr:7-carboxy-7-deazaguanine synthase QueE [Hydrococcus sp. Prado102]
MLTEEMQSTDRYVVQEIFNSVQGEGELAGKWSSFIRLYGCPLSCPFCDTGYGGIVPQNKIVCNRLTFPEILEQLRSDWVVITGGEPFIHRHKLQSLIYELYKNNKQVQIETSGAFWVELPKDVWVTLSPKEHCTKYVVVPDMWERASEIKLVISSGLELDFYRSYLQSATVPIYLQPEWYGMPETLKITLECLQQFPTAKLSIQMHKYLGLL